MKQRHGVGLILAGVAGVAVVTGWAIKRAFPRAACPKCGGSRWSRLGGGLKRCAGCGHAFYVAARADRIEPSAPTGDRPRPS